MENKIYNNRGQFLVLLILCLIIFANKLPVIFDKLNHIESYRLHDGLGDAISNTLCSMVSIIVLITMKIKNSKSDFIVVLLFSIGLLICIPILGIVNFMISSIIASILFIYIISRLLKNLSSASH